MSLEGIKVGWLGTGNMGACHHKARNPCYQTSNY